jgi:hypothetical protein
VTNTATATATRTSTPTVTNTPSATLTYTPSITYTPTATATRTYTPTVTNTATATATSTSTPTPTVTPTPVFADVPNDYSVTLGGVSYPLHDYIQALYDGGYTAGCSTNPPKYCPDQIMTRAESAVFILRGNFGSGYVPPAAPWDRFGDNWSPGPWAEKWAEGMWNAGFTAGCQTPASNPNKLFCPWDQFPREQGAVFGLRMKYGMSYTPPAATGTVFADMTDTGYWATKWAEKAYSDGLLPGCGTQNGKPLFCPSSPLSRAWGAYLIVKARGLLPTP